MKKETEKIKDISDVESYVFSKELKGYISCTKKEATLEVLYLETNKPKRRKTEYFKSTSIQ